MRWAVGAVVGAAALAGCIAEGADDAPPACTSASDCNAAAGEVCDEGVCWGDPPAGAFAALLSPAEGARAARTEVPDLAFSTSGWMTGDLDGPPQLVLASTVRVRGVVQAPCPATLADCDGTLVVPATVKFSRPSSIDERRVAFEATANGDEYQVVLPRPTSLVTYQVTITPSDAPLAPGEPSPAELIAPRRVDVSLDPSGGDDVRLDLVLTEAASHRQLQGSIVRPPPAPIAGWRVHAEAPSLDDSGGFERVSNVARVDASGTYKLWLPVDRGAVDLVVSPPVVPNSPEVPAPGLRRRGLDASGLFSLPPMMMPAAGEVTAAVVSVTGTGGGGDTTTVDGARVVARLDLPLEPDLFLVHRVIAATGEHGVAGMLLWAPPAGTRPYEYAIDVLPGSGAEQASRIGWPLVVEPGVAPAAAIALDRREPIRGQIVDEHGVGVGGATVSAVLSAATRCELTTPERAVARALPSLTATTAPDGGFVLWVDRALVGRDVRYDVQIEPTPDSAPSWTYRDVIPGGSPHGWQLPPAAHVRGQVRLASGDPAADTLVQIYQRIESPEPCASQNGVAATGAVQVRAVGRADADGVVRLVLPRTVSASAPR